MDSALGALRKVARVVVTPCAKFYRIHDRPPAFNYNGNVNGSPHPRPDGIRLTLTILQSRMFFTGALNVTQILTVPRLKLMLLLGVAPAGLLHFYFGRGV
jgi:hypothetical protein